eukprot:6485004-Amphidinium_carterae.2
MHCSRLVHHCQAELCPGEAHGGTRAGTTVQSSDHVGKEATAENALPHFCDSREFGKCVASCLWLPAVMT